MSGFLLCLPPHDKGKGKLFPLVSCIPSVSVCLVCVSPGGRLPAQHLSYHQSSCTIAAHSVIKPCSIKAWFHSPVAYSLDHPFTFSGVTAKSLGWRIYVYFPACIPSLQVWRLLPSCHSCFLIPLTADHCHLHSATQLCLPSTASHPHSTRHIIWNIIIGDINKLKRSFSDRCTLLPAIKLASDSRDGQSHFGIHLFSLEGCKAQLSWPQGGCLGRFHLAVVPLAAN